MRARAPQRGIALIVAIVLVAIATIAATAIAFNSSLTARRGAGAFSATQALQVAEGAEALAGFALSEDLKSNRVDSLDEAWAQPFGPTEFDAGVILEAVVGDQQGMFNVNDLIDGNGAADPVARVEFERLLTLLGMETRWAALLTDWIDADTQPTFPDGAEDASYQGQTPAYRAPNVPITSVSELLALPGFGRANYQKLLPYIAALPREQGINICTASGFVLDAMTPAQQSYSLDETSLVNRRQKGCFPTMQEFQASMSPAQWQQMTAGGQRLVDNSHYFRLRSYITIGTTRLTLYSLIHRDSGGQIRPISRSFGTE
jgi:general secretion pathway protein K